MAENAVATEGTSAIGRLNAAQTGRLGQFGSELQQSALEALGTTLDRKLEITHVASGVAPAAGLASQLLGMYVVISGELRLDDGTILPALLTVGEDEAAALFNVSNDGSEDDYKARLEEAVQTAITDLSDFLTLSVSVNSGASLQFGVSGVELRNTAMNPITLPSGLAAGDLLSIELPVTADDGPPMDVRCFVAVDALPGILAAVDPSQAGSAAAAPAPAPAASAARPPAAAAASQQPALTPLPTGPGSSAGSPDPVVRPAQFSSFASQTDGASMTNIDLILDVQLRVTVELGRKLMSVRDILALGPGSVVELDKVAGEPVDVLVNDRLIATGEVVVADDNFGVRITDIVNPAKRLSSRS